MCLYAYAITQQGTGDEVDEDGWRHTSKYVYMHLYASKTISNHT